jgi:hypothetical protein
MQKPRSHSMAGFGGDFYKPQFGKRENKGRRERE